MIGVRRNLRSCSSLETPTKRTEQSAPQVAGMNNPPLGSSSGLDTGQPGTDAGTVAVSRLVA